MKDYTDTYKAARESAEEQYKYHSALAAKHKAVLESLNEISENAESSTQVSESPTELVVKKPEVKSGVAFGGKEQMYKEAAYEFLSTKSEIDIDSFMAFFRQKNPDVPVNRNAIKGFIGRAKRAGTLEKSSYGHVGRGPKFESLSPKKTLSSIFDH